MSNMEDHWLEPQSFPALVRTRQSLSLGSALEVPWRSVWLLLFVFNACLSSPESTLRSLRLVPAAHLIQMSAEEALSDSSAQSSALGGRVSTRSPPRARAALPGCVSDGGCPIFIRYSFYRGVVSTLWRQGCAVEPEGCLNF